MRRSDLKHQKGFSLIELIVVLVLASLLASMAGFGLVAGVRGYLMTAENAEITQKAQLVMSRLGREIIECFDCNAGNSYPNPFTSFTYSNILGERVLELDTDTLKLGSPDGTHALVDQVKDFALARENDGRINISLVMNHAHGGGDITFETMIFPRNLYD